MDIENERRFLLRSFPDINLTTNIVNIEQGYFELPSASDSFRVRIIGGSQASLALKIGKGISREQNEEGISLKLAKKLIEKCHHRIKKMRINYQGWEVDIFGEVLAGIILAEREMLNPDEKIELPECFGEVVEVTDSLTNLHLARLASDLQDTDSSAVFHLENRLKKINRIVITGGPCSGKSTMMEILKINCPDVHFVPEVATIIISQLGIVPGNHPLSAKRFQQAIYRTQKLFEATSVEFAIAQGKKAVIFDRGTVDAAAYFPGGVEEFETLLKTSIKDEYSRYDMVICLSVPSQEVYEENKTNNPARRETFSEAEELGHKIDKAWYRHPNFFNSVDELWDRKVNRVKTILHHSGITIIPDAV